MTGEEIVKQQRQSPDYFVRQRATQLSEEANRTKFEDAAGPALKDLAEAGFHVEQFVELGRDGRRYRAAVPILLKHLVQADYRPVARNIVRALTDASARPQAFEPLADYFMNLPVTTDEEAAFKWSVANALQMVVDDAHFDSLVELLRDRAHGTSRQQLLSALPRLRNSRRVAVALEALEDGELTGHAAESLRKMRGDVKSPRDVIERLEAHLPHETSWVAKEVEAAINALQTLP